MLITNTDKIYAIYIRTSRHIRWNYADYIARCDTIDNAIKVATERMEDTPFEYIVKDITTDNVVTTGFVNWNK